MHISAPGERYGKVVGPKDHVCMTSAKQSIAPGERFGKKTDGGPGDRNHSW